MKAEIKTTTKPERKVVDVKTEKVHVELSIPEAHYLLNLLGSSCNRIADLHALPEGAAQAMFQSLHDILGRPWESLYPAIVVKERL